jgi:hypothetical protein
MQATTAFTFDHLTTLNAFARPCEDVINTETRRIRHAAADLFRQGYVTEAELLTHSAMQHYPYSEDVLVIRALICEAQQNWPQAAAALERLVALQGHEAPVQSWSHWVRVLRCNGELGKARDQVLRALSLHPAHPLLASELAQLETLNTQTERKAA